MTAPRIRARRGLATPRSARRCASGSRLRTAAALAAFGLLATAASAPAQLLPDSVVPLEPLTVRVLRTSIGAGVPNPISVVAGDELVRARGGAYLEEAMTALPGIQIQNRFNLAAGERVSIRGFGARAQFGIRGIRVLVDGIPATLPDGQTALDHLDPGTLGRVEMLRGPGGALYGNAAGGVLHFETLAPAADLQADAEGSVGSFGLRTYRAAVSDAFAAPGTGYRVSASRYDFDGYRTNPLADDGSPYGDQARTVVSATLRTALAGGVLSAAANGMDMRGDNPGSLSATLRADDPLQAFRFNVVQGTREDIRQGQVGATWARAWDGVDAEVGAWGIRRDFLGAIPSDIVGFDRNAGGLRATLRGSTGGSTATLTLSGGVESEFQSDDRRNWDNDGGEAGALTLDQDESVRTVALFAQGRLDVGPRVGLLAAVRYDRFRFEADDRFLADGADDSGTRIMDAVTPSAGVVVEAAEDVELFASVARSFETPTTTELTNRPDGAGGFNDALEPTTGTTVEGGLRARLHRRLALEATLFRTDLANELVPFEVPSSPGRTFFRNAGESHHTGWELLVDGRPAPELGVRVAYTRVDARYDVYAVDGDDFAGNRVPGLAPWRLDGRLAWEPAAGFVSIRGRYQDAIPVDDADTVTSDAYFLADVRAGLTGFDAGETRVAPWVAVTNVLDRSYDTSVVVNAFGSRYFEPGPGRAFRFGVAVTLGG